MVNQPARHGVTYFFKINDEHHSSLLEWRPSSTMNLASYWTGVDP
jgi:hypothetical protein